MRIHGLVVKSYSNFFDVYVTRASGQRIREGTVLEVQLPGRFRRDSVSVLTGDRVVVSISFESTTPTGVIEEVEPRASELSRPAVANVDQVVLVFTLVQPELNWALLDRQLALAEFEELPVVMCLNKLDLVTEEEAAELVCLYGEIGYRVIKTSAVTGQGIPELAALLPQRITVLAGQSGVGKSSLINRVDPRYDLELGELSDRLGRGRHTTRHVQLLELRGGGWVADTPGFNYLELNEVASEQLAFCFPELERLLPACRFANCLHDHEPGCAVKQAVDEGVVDKRRYEHYLDMLNEIRQWEVNQYR